MAADQSVEERIQARAKRIWEEEGRPQGRADAHWEQARLIVALEDSQHTMLKPIQPPQAEPLEVIQNLGEFPTLTDQGEEQAYPTPPAAVTARGTRGDSGLGRDSSGELEEFSSPSIPETSTHIAQSASASAFARYLPVVFFMTAAGIVLSLILKTWSQSTGSERE